MSAQITLNLDSSEQFTKLVELLKNAGMYDKVNLKTDSDNAEGKNLKPRKAGWGKGLFTNISADFDETPAGFDEYMLPVQNQ